LFILLYDKGVEVIFKEDISKQIFKFSNSFFFFKIVSYYIWMHHKFFLN
jgi:hypothetical protein